MEALDLGIKTKLMCMLNDDFDMVLDLCMQQDEVHRANRALPKDQRAQLEREKVRLEKAIDKLMDQIELGQSVKDRLKLRVEELAQVKDRIARADEPALSRDLLADSLKPLGPLCALGDGDPIVIRQLLRKIGVTAITVTPDGNGWRFEGQADFKGAVHPRTHEGPPQAPRARRRPGGAGPPLDQVVRGSSASRRRSPTRLIARTVRRIASPGRVASHQATVTKSRPSEIIWPHVG